VRYVFAFSNRLLDSIATISEHLEAEAKEAESEGGNKGAGK
jgi:hypothetical protein